MSYSRKTKPEILVSGVMGHPVDHSLSPVIFGLISKYLKSPVVYKKLDVPPRQLRATLNGLKRIAILSGWNVTIPHKETTLKWMDEIAPAAQAIGAVNVVKHVESRFLGFNTDYFGIVETFREHEVKVRNRSILLFGSGGAARSVAYVLGQQKAKEVLVWNRTRERASKLILAFRHLFPATDFRWVSSLEDAKCRSSRLFVNATPLGMKGFPSSGSLFPRQTAPGAIAFDLVYQPQVTPFLAQAREQGIRGVGGLDMLVWQALAAWEIWMGKIQGKKKLKNRIKSELLTRLGGPT